MNGTSTPVAVDPEIACIHCDTLVDVPPLSPGQHPDADNVDFRFEVTESLPRDGYAAWVEAHQGAVRDLAVAIAERLRDVQTTPN